jgi:DNA-binding NtrC family response regulator
MTDRRRVLVVEPDAEARQWLQIILRPFGDVIAVADGTEALAALQVEPHIDVVTTELTLPDQSGRQLLRRLHRRFPETAVIIITHVASLRAALYALRNGAGSYLLKPFDVSDLMKSMEEALANRHAVCVS